MSITGGDEVALDFPAGPRPGRGRPGRSGSSGPPDRDKLLELRLPWSETTHLVELRTNALRPARHA